MNLIIEPYKHVSAFTEDKIVKGASIVELLTDYRTPCYVYKKGDDTFGPDMIATNVGFTLSYGNLTSFVFEAPMSDEIYIVKYISGIKKIIPGGTIPTNPEKQLPKSYFSEILVNGNYEDMLSEFKNHGWEVFRNEDNPEAQKRRVHALMELFAGHGDNYDRVKKEALEFYRSQSSALNL